MTVPEGPFRQIWPRCFVVFIGIIQALATIIILFTELGNVATNFWTANVFAGGWCGLILLVQCVALFISGCCKPTPTAAFKAVVITVIALVACAALISFDALFIAQPSTCILTSSCATNANSTTIFSYTFQQNFWSTFNSLSAFKSYSLSQSKFLFQTVQLGVGGLSFILCIIILIIYYVCSSKAKKQVAPADSYGSQQQQQQQNGRSTYRPGPRAPQAQPGDVAWNNRGRY